MGKKDKLIAVARFNTELNRYLDTDYDAFIIFRSKGLLAHLIKRQHFQAAKYYDYLPDIITNPDYIGLNGSVLEMVKCYKDNIFITIKLDIKKNRYYVATMFDIKEAKLDSYIRSGRLVKTT